MENVEKVDVDSLIYLKYLVYKIKNTDKKNIQMSFHPPKNKETLSSRFDRQVSAKEACP